MQDIVSGKVPRFQTCIIHIGTEKTGTSAIQDQLIVNRRHLLADGVLYPKTLGTYHSSHWEILAAVHPDAPNQEMGRAFGIKTTEDQARYRDALRADLQAEFDRHKTTQTLLISCEHMHSRVSNPNHIELIKDFLAPWVQSFKIIVYFRRQDEVALGRYSTGLKSSVPLTIEQMRKWMSAPRALLLYDSTFEKWRSVFGADAMVPRIYDPTRWPEGDLVRDFAGVLGISINDRRSRRVNLSLNRQGFQFLQALNKRFPVTPGDRSDPARRALVKEISASYAGKFMPFSRSEMIDFYNQYKDANEKLRLLAFPEEPSPLFGSDFSSYPETAEALQPDYGDAVDIAFHLWRKGWRPPATPERVGSRLAQTMGDWRRQLFPGKNDD